MRLIFLCLFSTLGFASIQEISSVKTVEPLVEEGTLVLFDLDNTVMKPAQSLGSHQWYDHLVEKYQKEEKLSRANAKRRARLFWDRVHGISKMVLIEPESRDLIKKLKAQGHRVLGLTARTTRRYHDTHRQLRELSVEFRTKEMKDQILDTPKTSGFFGGVLFAENNPKGVVLEAFLKTVEWKPKKIVFIDDRKSNLESVELSMKGKVPFVGLRYNVEDKAIKSFNPRITDVQEKYLGNILADGDALILSTPQHVVD